MISQALRVQVTTKQLEFDDLNTLLLEEESLPLSQDKVLVASSSSVPVGSICYCLETEEEKKQVLQVQGTRTLGEKLHAQI